MQRQISALRVTLQLRFLGTSFECVCIVDWILPIKIYINVFAVASVLDLYIHFVEKNKKVSGSVLTVKNIPIQPEVVFQLLFLWNRIIVSFYLSFSFLIIYV